jgi:hypothetical protein
MMAEIWHTIEDDGHGGFTVYEHGTYEETSVLAGMPSRTWRQAFDTIEETKEAYPEAQVSGSTKMDYAGVELPQSPPDWFDPANAGETWDEEDYY